MPTPRVYQLAAAACLSLPGCAGKQPAKSTATASEPAAAPAASPEGPKVGSAAGSTVEKVEVLASFEGVNDMLKSGQELFARVKGEAGGGDPKAELQAALLAQGFGPGFLEGINLDGKHAFQVAFPAGDSVAPDAFEIAATFAVFDGRKVLEAMPASTRPQPLGDNLWELRKEDDAVLIRETGQELLLGRSEADVTQAAGLAAALGEGRRIRVRAWNLPADQFDPAELLGLPVGIPAVAAISGVLKELSAAEVQFDFGTGKPIEVVTTAEAPFGQLGLEPVGPPRSRPTPLEAALPAGAVFATSFSYGDPALLNKTLNTAIPMDAVPAPFDGIVKGAVEGAHKVLDSVAADVVAALYLDPKGQATLVLAAGVDASKQATALEGLRTLHGSVVQAFEAHAAMQGKNADAKFTVTSKDAGLRLSGVKADRVTVKVPPAFQADVADAGIFLKKNVVEAVSFVDQGVVLWAAGAGARTLASDVAKSLGKTRKTSMATEGTLAALRAGMDGCQVCMTFDGAQYLRLRLFDLRAKNRDKATTKKIKRALAKLAKSTATIEAGAGIRVGDKALTVGAVVPQTTLSTSKEAFAVLRDTLGLVEDAPTGSAT